MKRALYIALTLLICVLPAQSWAQEKGKARPNKPAHAQKQDKARGAQKPGYANTKPHSQRAAPQKADHARGSNAQGGKQKQAVDRRVGKRDDGGRNVRTVTRSVAGRSGRERAAIVAVTDASRRGINDDAFVITTVGERVRVKNRSGRVLLDMDNDRARNMGYWNVRPLSYDVQSSAPSFCRSGAGHPVWGRQWCVDKGFGLGRYREVRWGRATTIGDIIFGRRYDSGNLVGDALLGLIGAVAYDRLALHAISLGYADPLTGMWIGEPYGPRVLQVYSAGYPVAEIVDADRDDRADVLVVALRL